MPVLVNNLQEKIEISEDIEHAVNAVVDKILKQSEFPDAEVGVVLVDNDYIHTLNKQYRDVDSSTDVLSFALMEGEDELLPSEEEDVLLGDIIISMEKAEQQAKEYGHSFLREVAYLTAHGMFHLLGYDHNTEEEREIMREQEEQVLSQLNITR